MTSDDMNCEGILQPGPNALLVSKGAIIKSALIRFCSYKAEFYLSRKNNYLVNSILIS